MTAVRRLTAVRRVKCQEFSLDSHSKVSSPCPDSVKLGEIQQPVSDAEFHEEILLGVDDSPLRILSARRVVAMGFTREQAEELFSAKLPDYDEVI